MAEQKEEVPSEMMFFMSVYSLIYWHSCFVIGVREMKTAVLEYFSLCSLAHSLYN